MPDAVLHEMNDEFLDVIFSRHQQCGSCPSPTEVAELFDGLLGLLFPNFSTQPIRSREELLNRVNALKASLRQLSSLEERGIDLFFIDGISKVYQRLQGDIEAIYLGDPAATSTEEVVRSYPGFYAIAAYRIAHELLNMRVPVLPRSITELAHGRTGIDIHPGASIGLRFCIDHGTGVVIGETTHIGNDVKIYQGVTLGALSVDKKLADTKRHPTIEDDVVIYSGATILGGKTVIGKGSVIGGNVWITESVPPYSRAYYKAKLEQQIGKQPTNKSI